ncbi:ABC transporter ATP-binding protein [Paenibacillus eucommiae]|uniref:ATP-binding cassette subfamily C protein n=1 Tax=Paenibacillus eucommiae TaxID=1355755 RepID=A0ABS4IYT0_9BACL|nr:ABC transporter ATP-binding protein [Paenibacillus eucommiae]MBP1991694.1 ATP-binding cassette subfamily C protein [Paenibacillus eucommiae]
MANLWVYIRKLHHYAGLKLYVPQVGMMIISMIEGIGYFLLAAMLGLIGLFDASSGAIPFLSTILEPLKNLPVEHAFSITLVIFLVMWTGQALLQRYLSVMNEKISHGFVKYLRLEIHESIMRANWSFFLKKRRSDLINNMTNELHRVNYGVYVFLGLILMGLFTLVQIFIALWLSVELTLTVLVCGIALGLYSRKFVKNSRAYGEQATSLTQAYMAGMTNHFNGIKEIKSNLMEQQHVNWFRELCDKMEWNSIQFMRLQNRSTFYHKIVSGFLISIFMYTSVVFYQVQAEKLVFIIMIFSRLWPRFASIQNRWEQLSQSLPAFNSLIELEKDYKAARVTEIQLASQTENIRVEQDIEYRNVYYRYDPNQKAYALQDISLRMPANSMTAIIGKSGAGKSTLVDLLIGLIEPEKGQVLIDGKELSAELSIRVRGSVGYVPQDPFLFHSTIKKNFYAAAPDATDEEMWEALRFAASEELVRQMPDGLETVIGERGVRLSGGERQRIVLARAILRKPAILILDEATSALDSDNEAIIQESIERLRGSMTIIVIAHRLSTLRHADQVIVLDKGRLIQQGGYNQLSKQMDGLFGQLLEIQKVQ